MMFGEREVFRPVVRGERRYVYHDPWVKDDGSAFGAIGAGLYDANKPCMTGEVYARRQWSLTARLYATPCPVCVLKPDRIAYDARVMRVDGEESS